MIFDTIIVGSGIAGLYTALRASKLGSVAVITKAALEESNTRYAQGGIAAAWFPDDSPVLHASDTLAAGAGLSDPKAVRVLCEEAPARIADLLAYGVAFDIDGDSLARGLEGAHSVARVLHAGGDATGARIAASLSTAVRDAGVALFEHAFVTDFLVESGRVHGVGLLGREPLRAAAVILASGGAGHLYLHTTNPLIATGDGVAAAFRAGAALADVEFFQFHPTALAAPGVPTFLISEAVRGEGGVLRDARGERFVDELAPRDAVARAIASALERGPVVLDVTHLGARLLSRRFPQIDAFCRAHGFDWAREPLSVTPAAHYWMGGVLTNLWGETTVPGLYACGEAAATGVHGANRLASNSLVEAVVFGARIVDRLASSVTSTRDAGQGHDPGQSPVELDPIGTPCGPRRVLPSRQDLQRLMWDSFGLTRLGSRMSAAHDVLLGWQADPRPSVSAHEDANLLTLSRLLAAAAIARTESRGAHHRLDHPQADPRWARRLILRAEVASSKAAVL